MRKLAYHTSTGEVIELDVPESVVGTGVALRGSQWGYKLNARSVSSITHNAREITLDLYVEGLYRAEQMCCAFDYDFINLSPGELVYNNEWHQQAYIAKSEVAGVFHDHANVTLTVILLDGIWYKTHAETFEVAQENASQRWLNLPTNTAFNLGETRRPSTMTVKGQGEHPVRLTIFGTATRPSIRIGKNVYEFSLTLGRGEYLVCDASKARKTIARKTDAGDNVDVFSYGVRGTGKGGGRYCFESLPNGELQVSWDGSFAFRVEWMECRGGLPWVS